MAKSKTENITQLPYSARVKLVRERLANLRRPDIKPLPKPINVKAAESILRDWQKRNDEHEDAQRDAWRAKVNEVQDALILGDMERAVKLMRALGV